jgi:hypothetical protein
MPGRIKTLVWTLSITAEKQNRNILDVELNTQVTWDGTTLNEAVMTSLKLNSRES